MESFCRSDRRGASTGRGLPSRRGLLFPDKEDKQPAPPKSRPGKKGKKQGAPQKPEREPVLPPSLSKKRKPRRDSRPRPVEAPPRSDRQKDSTQQKSLMRPYYLHDDD